MPLQPGARLGPYEVQSAIGAGGMGEVYRAHDTKLHRSVAIKALPDSFAADPDRLARFEREARVLASLNHSHIAHVYGLETQGARSFIVMELVDGETLTEWIARQPRTPPIDDVTQIARQIAEALEAAHEQGIVHRDLKPANIKVTANGAVKVLDFGLAKSLDTAGVEFPEPGAGHDPDNSPTITSPAMTGRGVILGTAAYMSPEQAKGKPVDKRADIWAFGCVMFEMLTGQRAFRRDTVPETLAAVMRDAPPLDRLPRDTPDHVRALLVRCLERDPRRRLRDIGEARVLLEQPSAMPGVASPSQPASTRWQTWSPWLPWAVALTALIAAGVIARAGWTAAPPLSRTAVPIQEPHRIFTHPMVALSPDGQRLAYIAVEGDVPAIYLRGLDSFDSIRLPGTEDARALFFSPDGEWIGFWAVGRIKKVAVRGGPPVVLAAVTDFHGAAWTRSGTIISSTSGPTLAAVPEDGGQPQLIPAVPGTVTDKALPHLLPDDRTLLYAVGGVGAPSAIAARRLDANTEKVLVNEATHPAYFDGHLIFARAGTLFAARFDAATLEVLDTPAPVFEGVLFNASFQTTQYSIAANGRLAFMPAAPPQARQLAFVDRAGAVSTVDGLRGRLYMPRVAPNGRHVAVTVMQEDGYSISIFDLATGSVSDSIAGGMAPVWSPDGRRIAYASVHRGGGLSLHVVPIDRNSPAVAILADGHNNLPTSWSPDGSAIVITRVVTGGPNGEDVFLIAPDGSKLRPAVETTGNQDAGTLSPDGRWLAYLNADEEAIFIGDAANMARRWRADVDGGANPAWSPDGRELWFLAGPQRNQLSVVRVTPTAGGLELARPVRLATAAMGTGIGFGLRRYDVMPDGNRIVIVTADAPPPPEIRVLLDFRSHLAMMRARQ